MATGQGRGPAPRIGLEVKAIEPVDFVGVRALDALDAIAERGADVAEQEMTLGAPSQGAGLRLATSGAFKHVGLGFFVLQLDWLSRHIISM